MTIRGGDEILLAFGRALRAGGVPVTPDRTHDFLSAAALLGADDPGAVRTAGRSTLCASPDDLSRFDQVFEAFFNPRDGLPRRRPATHTEPSVTDLPVDDETGEGVEEADDVIRAAASAAEVLRHRDVAAMSASEKQRLAAMFATLRPRPSLRRTARHQRWRRGQVDASRTLRESLRRMGEPSTIEWRRRARRPRRVVLLVDVSGSMGGYADVLLRFAHAATRRRGVRTEVFTLGTRLTRVTREMAGPDPERAMGAVAAAVPDWSGGTRLGVLLREFLDRWGQRGVARGAVVVIMSDGWERDDPALLGAQMRRLALLARRVVWCNPRAGRAGFAPLAGGLAAALPYVDDFVSGHSLAALEQLARIVAGVEVRGA